MLRNDSALSAFWPRDGPAADCLTPRTTSGVSRVVFMSVLHAFDRVMQDWCGQSVARQLAGDDAVAQDEDARAHGEQVAHVRRGDDHAEAALGLSRDELVERDAGR